MNVFCYLLCALLSFSSWALPVFQRQKTLPASAYQISGQALCATAKETLAYLNQGSHYDPEVIHEGKVFRIPLSRVKASLAFICKHPQEMEDPLFLRRHFDFYQWIPDQQQVQTMKARTKLLVHLPPGHILMTKYYVHKAKASANASKTHPFALYGLPQDEASLSLEQANAKPWLTRFQYGKQAILKGALRGKKVPVLAYVNRNDLEAALLQGTIVADFGTYSQYFNVHRTNNIPYVKGLNPYHQERYWYFKAVDGIKGYGKDADHKITVNTGVTFAADLKQLGLGKLLLVQYHTGKGRLLSKVGILADTGGAFENNLYQVDFLTGSYAGKDAFYAANKAIPDYVTAYFMVLK